MPKGGIGPNERSGRKPTKKKPPANRFTLAGIARDLRKDKAGPSEPEPARPSSASENKLHDCDAVLDPERASWSGFRLVDIDRVFRNITEVVGCRKCRAEVKIQEKRRIGLSSIFEVVCSRNCGQLKTFRNSELVKGSNGRNESEANRRLVLASQVLGIKHSGMMTLCASLDLPPPISQKTYDRTIKVIHEGIKEEARISLHTAIEEEVRMEGKRDVKCSGDGTIGTWQRRGFSSKNGTISLIGALTGKVIDVQVLTTVYHGCSSYKGKKEGVEYEEWQEAHAPLCHVNHAASSGMMEVNGMVQIFKRSLDNANVRHSHYIGDGDSRTFPAIINAKPYGVDLIPLKIECTGHVQKRMGTRLRNLKKNLRGKKLEDGKPIGGKGCLTEKFIDKLSSFYGNAVRSSSFVMEMSEKIWAIFYHYRSTDEDPQHPFCPTGGDSWCKYQKTHSQGQVAEFGHTPSVPQVVMDAIKPIFCDLTKQELLEKCVGGYTQNPNESFNSVVWKYVPKNVFCGLHVLEIGVNSAVLTFNDGCKSYIKFLKRINVVPGEFCVNYCNTRDRLRIQKSRRKSLESTKEARKGKRQQSKEKTEKMTSMEGEAYAPGAF